MTSIELFFNLFIINMTGFIFFILPGMIYSYWLEIRGVKN